jgi:molybdate transport system ATP-binding protein
MSTAALEVRLESRLPGFTLDVSWSMADEITVLFGHSGSGKTMTLEMIAGLARPGRGHVRVGETVLHDAEAGVDVPMHRRRVGYVFQQSALFPHMTVRGNVEYALAGAGMGRARAGEIMDALGVVHLSARYPREISGGQAQRVALARALAGRPRVLLLDEPFGALDSPVRIRMQQLLKDVRREFSVPMVFVTHDPQEALSMADRLVVYSAGRVAAAGPMDEVMRTASAAPALVGLLHPAHRPAPLVPPASSPARL